jgi:pyruvate,water dikinase
VESQEIAGKDVMTVCLPEGTREEPVPEGKRTQTALTAPLFAELARLGAQIEQLFGLPMDIEWAMRDGRFFILQARPITALPEPRATLDWKLPRARGRYWRGSVIELLPDPLSPLFATMALPLWSDAMRRLIQHVGPASMLPAQALITINDYAYYDYNLSPSQKVRVLLAIPRLMTRAFDWLGRAQARWAQEARPHYVGVIGKWAARDLSATPTPQLLLGAREIAGAAADHYLAIQSGILPAAYGSEVVFAFAYNHLAKRKDDPPALIFLLGFDSAPILAEKSLYDLAMWTRGEPDLAGYLTRATSGEIAVAYRSQSGPVAVSESWPEFCRRLGEHLDRFGHAVYDLDFAKSLPADDPTPLLEMLKHFLAGQARSPYDRQSETARARDQATQSLLARLKGIRLRLFKWLLARAQRYAPLREDALADVGLGWPILRRLLREAGRRLTSVGALAECEDVFWLKADEAEAAARTTQAKQAAPDYRGVVAVRRALWERERAVTPPMTLPIKGGTSFLGIDFSGMMPARTNQAAGNTIKGHAASPGRVAGVARVIHGPGEFSQMRQGDILVAKITTPAWTPLFALAAAVVTDVGGPLSHSSIIAREYHVPAVLGTGVATARIHSGQRITVDGDSGVVKMGG